MKEEAIQKINKLGHVGQVLALIAKIILGFAMFVLLISTIVMAVIPDDIITVDVENKVGIHFNLSGLGVKFTEKEQEEIVKSLSEDYTEDAEVALNGEEMIIEKVEAREDGFDMYMDGGDITFSGMRKIMWMLLALLVLMIATFVTFVFVGKLCKAFRNCETPFAEDVIKNMKRVSISLIPTAIFSSVSDGLAAGLLSDEYTFGINVGMVFVVILILALTYVFKYGAMLQQESDETL